MANDGFYRTALIGGDPAAVDGIDGDDVVDKDLILAMVSNILYIYEVDADSAAAESSPDVIAFDANGGDKRAVLKAALAAGATTEVLVGGGAGTAAAWTTATGTGAPVRAGSPTLTTQVTVPKVTNAAALTLESTGAGVNVLIHSDAGDNFTVGTNKLVVAGDIGSVGIGNSALKTWTLFTSNLQIGDRTVIGNRPDTGTIFAANYYFDGTHKRIETGYANRLQMQSDNGVITLDTAATAAADSEITWINGFNVQADGDVTFTYNVGVGTTAPGNPLAVNRAADGVIVDFESADTVEGSISIAANTTTYGAFVGSHYAQLKDDQAELPGGAVVISTGEIIPCSVSKQKFTEANPLDAVMIIDKVDAVEIKDIEVEDKDIVISEETTYAYDPETEIEKPTAIYTYGTKTVQKKQLKDGVHFHEKTRKFYTIKSGYVKKDDKFYLEETVIEQKPNKEYFVYVDTTTAAADKRAYGVWLGKLSDDATGMSFGKDSDPVYLIAQVGLFKIRVTDTSGNIANGDYLETSTRAMEAQKQSIGAKSNSTIAKAMINVDWATVKKDLVLGYKWKLIPCTF